jgi:hypothetical protein
MNTFSFSGGAVMKFSTEFTIAGSPGYGRLVDGFVRFAHTQAPGPVFLLGTSQGSIAAMNGAAHAAPGSIAGVVLTESVSRMGRSGETVFGADQDVTAPALVVANRYDACDVPPPEDAPQRSLRQRPIRPDVRVLAVAGGITKSIKACGSLTPLGYYGIEMPVIEQISQWMRAPRPRPRPAFPNHIRRRRISGERYRRVQIFRSSRKTSSADDRCE